MSVDRSPSAVVIGWGPGFDHRRCWAELVLDGPRIARALAAAVDTAPAFPPGSRACPLADESAVDLSFRCSRRQSELADVGLSGCEGLGAPGRGARLRSDDLAAVLRPLAAAPWRNRVSSP